MRRVQYPLPVNESLTTDLGNLIEQGYEELILVKVRGLKGINLIMRDTFAQDLALATDKPMKVEPPIKETKKKAAGKKKSGKKGRRK